MYVPCTCALNQVFVITLGLAEVWFQKRKVGRTGEGTGEVAKQGAKQGEGEGEGEGEEEEEALWRAVPSDRFDPTRHGFRVSSVRENLLNLREIVGLIREHVPAAVVVRTEASRW